MFAFFKKLLGIDKFQRQLEASVFNELERMRFEHNSAIKDLKAEIALRESAIKEAIFQLMMIEVGANDDEFNVALINIHSLLAGIGEDKAIDAQQLGSVIKRVLGSSIVDMAPLVQVLAIGHAYSIIMRDLGYSSPLELRDPKNGSLVDAKFKEYIAKSQQTLSDKIEKIAKDNPEGAEYLRNIIKASKEVIAEATTNISGKNPEDMTKEEKMAEVNKILGGGVENIDTKKFSGWENFSGGDW